MRFIIEVEITGFEECSKDDFIKNFTMTFNSTRYRCGVDSNIISMKERIKSK